MRSLHDRSTSLVAAALCAFGGACSTTPGLTVQATPASIGGDGLSPITVTAHVSRGGTPVDGQSVHFTASMGSFVGGSGASIDVSTQAGDAVATMNAPRQGRGQIMFTVSTSIDGTQPTAAAMVTLVPQGGAASSLTFTCARQNIGALVSGRLTPVHVQCTATAFDAHQQPIPNASIETMTEAGTLTWVADDNGKQIFVYTVEPGANPPKDVLPLDGSGHPEDVCPSACNLDPRSSACVGEPCWLDPTGITHNPRDGIATLVAAVPGSKSFDDQGEPYVDTDDDNAREAGEQFIDVNGNGKWDAMDGTVKERMLWKAVRVIWSGEADFDHNVAVSTVKYTSSGGVASGTMYFNDKNLNALAADSIGGSDTIGFSAGTACSLGDSLVVAPDLTKFSQDPGILFKASDGSISTPGLHSTYLQHTDYNFTAQLAAGGKPGQTCGVSGTVSRQYDAGAPGFDPDGSATETLGATLQF